MNPSNFIRQQGICAICSCSTDSGLCAICCTRYPSLTDKITRHWNGDPCASCQDDRRCYAFCNECQAAWATEIKLRAERKAGEMLQALKNAGEMNTGVKMAGRDKLGGTLMLPPKDITPTLAERSISKKQSSHWQRIAEIPE